MSPIQNETLSREPLLIQSVPLATNSHTTSNDFKLVDDQISVSPSIEKILRKMENGYFNLSDPVEKYQTYNDLHLATQDLKLNKSRSHFFGSNLSNIDNGSKLMMPTAATEKEKREVTVWLKEFTVQYERFLNEVEKLKTRTNDGIKINTYQMAEVLLRLRNSWIGNPLGNAHNNTEAEKFRKQFSILRIENDNTIFVNVDALFKRIIDSLGYDNDAYNRMTKLGHTNFKDHFQNKEFLYSDEAWSKIETILQNIKKDSQYTAWKISGDYPIVTHDKLMEKFIQAAQNMDSQYVKEVEKAVTQVKAFLEEYANLRNELAKMTEFKDGKRVFDYKKFVEKLNTLKNNWKDKKIGEINGHIKKEFWERFPILKAEGNNIVINSEYLLQPSIDVLEKMGTLKGDGKKEWTETEWLQVNTALDNASRNLNSEISGMANAYSTAISDSSRFYNLLSSFIEQLRQADLEFVKSI